MKHLAPLRRHKLSRFRQNAVRAIKRRFHKLSFGDELARVNLEMARPDQLAYLAWMRRSARRNGVPRQPGYSVAWLLKVEEELDREPTD